MFDYELTLINLTYQENDMGDSVGGEPEPTTILCGLKSVTRSEYYAAAKSGLKPEMVFVVNRYDYSKQSEVEFEGNRYKVIREYRSGKSNGLEDFETIELVCQGVLHNGE
jgi:hypothetical protein